jgi:hypothetical protein
MGTGSSPINEAAPPPRQKLHLAPFSSSSSPCFSNLFAPTSLLLFPSLPCEIVAFHSIPVEVLPVVVLSLPSLVFLFFDPPQTTRDTSTVKMKAVLLSLAFFAAAAVAQSTACAADYIVEACLGTENGKLASCATTDYVCRCNAFGNILTYVWWGKTIS